MRMMVPVGTAFRFERRLHGFHLQTELAHHFLKDVVIQESQATGLDLHRDVTIA